jgi:hypothetical protein
MEDYYFYGENKQYNTNSDVDIFFFDKERYTKNFNTPSSFNNTQSIDHVLSSLDKIKSFVESKKK